MQNVKSECKNNAFKMHAPTWSKEFHLLNGSYNISDLQNYFEWIIKGYETVRPHETSAILIYPNKIKNRIVFKIKTGYKLELLTNEIMKLLKDGPIIDKDKNGQNVPELVQVDSVLIHFNVVHNEYLQNSKLLYTFVPDKSFGQLLSVEPETLLKLKTTDSVFDHIEIWFIDQNNNSLQIEDSVNATLIIQTRTFVSDQKLFVSDKL